MIIHAACHSLTQAEGQPISLWPAESNARAGFVVPWLSMIASSETPTYGVKRVFGSVIWPDTADELLLLKSHD